MCSVAQLHPILCDLVDCSPPGSSVHEVFRQEYWSGCHFLLQGIFLTQELTTSLVSPALEGGFFTTEPPGKPNRVRGDPKSCSFHYSRLPLCFYRKKKRIKTWPLLSRSLGPNGTARHVNEYWLGQKESLFRFSIASYEKPN